ncbi:MAG: hypothetical protein ACE5HX_17575 [bacterium]
MKKESEYIAAIETPTFKLYGWIGILIMVISEISLMKNNVFIKRWFTPIMWTGYILFLDAWIYRLRGTSLIQNRGSQFLFMLPYSVGCWLIFEAYNLHLQNWKYLGLPENLLVRYFAYAWSFAAIFPGVLLTSELIDISGIFNKFKVKVFVFRRTTLLVIMIAGVLLLIMPLLFTKEIAVFLFGPVWIGFVLLLDPINYFMDGKSLFKELQNGRLSKLFSLFLAGLICGLLWEFWNYWASAKWVYIFPYLTTPKVFEMPLFGFLGFLPFAVEVYVMWEFAVRILKFKTE